MSKQKLSSKFYDYILENSDLYSKHELSQIIAELVYQVCEATPKAEAILLDALSELIDSDIIPESILKD